ncbi:hypothetical protein [Bifidobacterium callimiconis]|uniref:Uncharacterized protein n=1 Tax=Bifidobacterium callimiconis TaxID=2306973 RepID=A0A430FET6_9BIFI|nr:hypothetical protein [Bifidobacterium callimiconis]RSX51252.1 hypothetical protein D2E23_1097 [Bifidobacterium callimiconis]
MLFLQVFDGDLRVDGPVPLARVSSRGGVEPPAGGWSLLARESAPVASAAVRALEGRYGLADGARPVSPGPWSLVLDCASSSSGLMLMEVGFSLRPVSMRGLRVRSGRAADACWALDSFLRRLAST